ncbi:winged helix-turn-helix domain-containing protein [Brachybacterium endophyticum]|uniref:winged helix-turn-helix domain-containing protein n=1 Tax=Brachybacterium endophyticum TaxID=2182385 RepID=UPI00140415CB|nr:winged helix-turn-helix domain-containing protein [Brachybacterium endophyticum]
MDAVEFGVPEAAPDAATEDVPGATRVRYGLLQRTVLEALRDRGTISRREVFDEIAGRIELNEAETVRTSSGRSRYETAIVWGSVDMIAAEWIEKTREGWTLTERGKAFLEETPESVDISVESRTAYQAALAAKRTASVTRLVTE